MGNRRQAWPYDGAAASGPALSLSPDGVLNSGRRLAGTLRVGTSAGVGPQGALLEGLQRGRSDFGMDRITPRAMDHIGVSYQGAASPTSRWVADGRENPNRRR